jgi:hypothetical protein
MAEWMCNDWRSFHNLLIAVKVLLMFVHVIVVAGTL